MESLTCPGCGGYLPETMVGPTADPDRLYELHFVGQCAGCYAHDIASKAHSDDEHTRGKRYQMMRAKVTE